MLLLGVTFWSGKENWVVCYDKDLLFVSLRYFRFKFRVEDFSFLDGKLRNPFMCIFYSNAIFRRLLGSSNLISFTSKCSGSNSPPAHSIVSSYSSWSGLFMIFRKSSYLEEFLYHYTTKFGEEPFFFYLSEDASLYINSHQL